jgi:hypothetical protein
MNHKVWPVLILFAALSTACSSDNDPVADSVDNTQNSSENDSDNTDSENADNPGQVGATDPDPADEQSQSATYRVTFNASWSAATHPTNFPAAPHFSGLIGAVHGAQAILWEPGQIATDGIEQMAETGATGLLAAEIQAAIDEGRVLSSISGGGVGVSPGSVSAEFTVTRDNPQVTLVSMVAPSPDWFVGVHGLNLLDSDGAFQSTLSVDLAVYDAGTDSGLQYASNDADTQPREVITLLSSDSADSDFTGGQPFAGQFVFERL